MCQVCREVFQISREGVSGTWVQVCQISKRVCFVCVECVSVIGRKVCGG